jgi:hypothetical protein
MSRPLRLSSMMQLPTVTSQGAERRLKTHSATLTAAGASTVAAAMAMSMPPRVSSAMQLPPVMSQGVERRLERQRGTKSSWSLDSGSGSGDARGTSPKMSSTIGFPPSRAME